MDAQLRTLEHRGPDSSGIYMRPGAVIGQTRLAIIDLANGDPPITNEDGTIGVVLNGEIYNYRSLSERLRSDHHVFSTRCDTEVIAHMAEDLEPVDLARQLNGMFAFAVWDDRQRRLLLGRDRLGKKPLYYWLRNGRLVFGSEIKAVLAHPAVTRELNPEAIAPYLGFGYVPTPHTFFAGIESLPPAHMLTLDSSGVKVERYWEAYVPRRSGGRKPEVSMPEAASEVRSLLTQAVERRLVADVPLGAFLSGGVDSSAIVATMSQISSRPIQTFTMGFDDNDGFDERAFGRVVAKRFGTEHAEFVASPKAVDLVERLVWHHDQPFGDSSAIPTFLLAEATRRHVTVALCGDGGDELFAGYMRFSAAMYLARYRRCPASMRRAAARLASRIPVRQGSRFGSVLRFLAQSGGDVPDAFLAWVSYMPAEWQKELLGSPPVSSASYRAVWHASNGATLLGRLLDLNLRTYLLDDLLPKADRMSMAHGLEVRSPFLDHDLVEFALRLPDTVRVKGMTGKLVLKEAMKDLLPSSILHRKKRGFGVPLDRWFRNDLTSYLDSTIGSPKARILSYLQPLALQRLLAEHRTGGANHGHALWTLLTLEIFLRREGW